MLTPHKTWGGRGLVAQLVFKASRAVKPTAWKVRFPRCLVCAPASLAESALAAPHAGSGDVDFYPDMAQRAAILCSRLIRNHPLPDGNKRVAFLCMLDQLERDGLTWNPPENRDEIGDAIEQLAASELREEGFVDWVQRRVS